MCLVQHCCSKNLMQVSLNHEQPPPFHFQETTLIKNRELLCSLSTQRIWRSLNWTLNIIETAWRMRVISHPPHWNILLLNIHWSFRLNAGSYHLARPTMRYTLLWHSRIRIFTYRCTNPLQYAVFIGLVH